MSDERFQHLRLAEALLFASAEPLSADQIRRHLPEDVDVDELMDDLAALYANRGVNLVKIGARWAFRTASDVAPLMQIETTVSRKLSRAAVETLAIIAYHQPITRAEIEEVRGVALSRGTLDTLLEAGWVKPKGRRRTPGRPVTWGTSDAFLDQFGLESLDSLPGLAELKAAGLLDARPAVTAIGGRGHLLAAGEAGEDTEDEAPELALDAEFGEDLVPHESEATDDDPDTEAGEEEDSEASRHGAAGETDPEGSGAQGVQDARDAPKAAVATGHGGHGEA